MDINSWEAIRVEVNWSQVGQTKFERIVDALVARKWRGIAEVITPDGRGGDDGIDIEVRQGDRRRIYQLKHFPDGFSGDRKTTRQRQIQKSFLRAVNLEPAPFEWILVVPAKLTPGEREFVLGLSSKVPDNKVSPRIEIVDSGGLDQLLIDFPDVYRYLARDGMRSEVELYRLETETLSKGMPSLSKRLHSLGDLADSTDLYWGIDFARQGDIITQTLRPKDPRAQEKSPITISFTSAFAPEHDELSKQFERAMKFGASGRVVLPADVVRRVVIDGPAFIAGEHEGMEVQLEPLNDNPKLGTPAELRFYDETGTQVTSHEGRISYLNQGSEGYAMRIAFYGHLQVELLYPHDLSDPGHVEISYNFRQIRPDEALGLEQVLGAVRQPGLVCKVYLDDAFAATLAFQPREAQESPDSEVERIFRLAYDLKIVQDFCRTSFAIPNEMTTLERINMRVARLLIEGYVTACPEAPIGVVTLTGTDDPQLRVLLSGEPSFVSFTAQAVTFSLGSKELTMNEVLVFHPRVIAINGEEAKAALDSGRGEGFQLRLRPADDPYFYMAMPKRMGSPVPPFDRWEVAQWTLPGVVQPGVVHQEDALEPGSAGQPELT